MISLFSGIGGFEYAAEQVGFENVLSCEIDPFCSEFLKKRFGGIVHDDVCTLSKVLYDVECDIICGGFPCQDLSNAKQDVKAEGIGGARSGLVHEMLRIIEEYRPKYVISENVSNLLKINKGKDFGIILCELSRMGYDAEWRVVYASDFGAPHKRARCYLVAYPSGFGLEEGESFIPVLREEAYQKRREFTGAVVQAGGRGIVNPRFYAWMMGYPDHWLESI